MTLLLSIVLSIIGYFVLLFITSNLTGMVVRGFFRNANLEKMKKDEKTHPFIKQEIVRGNRAENVIIVVFFIISIMFLYFLYNLLNVWAVVSALLLIASRTPDLLWEISNGKKVTTYDRPKGGIYSITDIMVWIALPFLWWSLYVL